MTAMPSKTGKPRKACWDGLEDSGASVRPAPLRRMLPLCLLLSAAAMHSEAAGQELFATASAGGSNYQGELKDGTFNPAGTRPALGAGVLFAPSERFSVGLEFTHGMIGGSDSRNRYYFARRRNLHFDTRITEWSMTGRLNLAVGSEPVAIPYLTTGLALFNVDPFTTDASGQRVYLYPLSTEGQGLAGTGSPPHRRTHISVPIGGGFELRLTNRLRLDIELAARKTFTDHIDDVGTSYPDGYTLLSQRGNTAFELAYRGDELPGGDPAFPLAGTLRGNPDSKDWYLFLMMRLRYPIISRKFRHERVNHLFKGADWPYRN